MADNNVEDKTADNPAQNDLKKYIKLFASTIGRSYNCELCEDVGHNRRFHFDQFELARLFDLVMDAEESEPGAQPKIRCWLGPLAQSQSPGATCWLDLLNEPWPKKDISNFLRINRGTKLFVISRWSHMREVSGQFIQHYMNSKISGFDLERHGIPHKGPADDTAEALLADKIVSVQVSFPNGYVYLFNLVSLNCKNKPDERPRLPWQLWKYLRSKCVLKLGVNIFKDCEFLRDQYHQTVWGVVDLRYMYLTLAPMDYKINRSGLKPAALYICGRDMSIFNHTEWAKMISQLRWPTDAVTYACEDVILTLCIALTCTALSAPAHVNTIEKLAFYAYENVTPYIDVYFDEAQLCRDIQNAETNVLSVELSWNERIRRREHHRDKFYGCLNDPTLNYPHGLEDLFMKPWSQHPKYAKITYKPKNKKK